MLTHASIENIAFVTDKSVIKMKTEKNELTRRAFRVKEVASMLAISEASVRRLIDRGRLRPCRMLRHLLIPSDKVDALLK